jgi:hypothetical protein
MLINGGMEVAQLGDQTSFGATNNAIGACDQWQQRSAGTMTARVTSSQEVDGGVEALYPWHKLLVTTADASPGSTEGFKIVQKIETQNCLSVVNNTTGIEATTLSMDIIFHADGASSITFPATLALQVRTQVDVGNLYSYWEEVTITSADTWQRVSISIPADANPGFDRELYEDALWVSVGLYGGSTRTDAGGSWGTTDHYTTTGADNLMDATNNYIGFTNAKFEAGSSATDFVHETYNENYLKCLRYQYVLVPTGGFKSFAHGISETATITRMTVRFPVPMRAAPTLGDYTAAHWYSADTLTGRVGSALSISSNADTDIVYGALAVTHASGTTQYRPAILQSTASASVMVIKAEM